MEPSSTLNILFEIIKSVNKLSFRIISRNFASVKAKSAEIVEKDFPQKFPSSKLPFHDYAKVILSTADPLSYNEQLSKITSETAIISGMDQTQVVDYFIDAISPLLNEYLPKRKWWKLLFYVPSTSLLLAWIAVITIEYTNRPIVRIDGINKSDITRLSFLNSGGWPTEFRFYSDALVVDTSDTEDTINGGLVGHWNALTIYPDKPIRFPYPSVDSLIDKAVGQEEVCIKILWRYDSLMPNWMPLISNYIDSAYFRYDESAGWVMLHYPRFSDYRGYFERLPKRD